ncbi:hypothetical protein JNUCC64_16170 [Streptomyces sp. JNUCC 64]
MARQVWPLLALVSAALAAALVWYTRSGDGVLLRLAWELFETAALGLVGSFALHESAHVVVLRRIPTVTRVALVRTGWRTSVVPEGDMTARQIVAVAVAGPAVCALVGAALWLSALDRVLAWWYLAHLVFLLPFFGDGRSLRLALRVRREARGDGDGDGG